MEETSGEFVSLFIEQCFRNWKLLRKWRKQIIYSIFYILETLFSIFLGVRFLVSDRLRPTLEIAELFGLRGKSHENVQRFRLSDTLTFNGPDMLGPKNAIIRIVDVRNWLIKSIAA